VVVVLSIGKLSLGQQQYYLDQVAQGIEDYYSGTGEASGRWLASSDQLGLDGEVDATELRAVLQAHDPTDTYKLAATTNRKIAGFDLTFSAPKSVSVLWALGDPGVNLAVRDAHEHAIDSALAYLEREATFTRRGHGGLEVIETRGLVAAGFRHRTSRNGDPQLHTHVLVPNVVQGVDGRWGTLDARHQFAHRMTAGYLYQAELRHQLTKTLGVAWRPVQKGAGEIAGIPPELLRAFSTRRAEIEERLEILGDSSASASRRAALETRGPKLDLDSETLHARWLQQAAALVYDPQQLNAVLGHAAPLALTEQHASLIEEHLASAQGLTARASSFDRKDVVRAMAGWAPTGVDALQLQDRADVFLRRPDVVALASDMATTRYSTMELLDTETRLLTTAVGRQREGAGYCPPSRVNSVVHQYPTLSEEQARLVAHLTTSGNGVDLVVAAAGTGKTFALDATRDVWERCGYRVHGAALAGRAAVELEQSANIPAITIARLTKQLQRQPLTPRDVLVIDEAGMVGTRTLAPILDAAARGGAKVVLVGDDHQLPEIDAGGLLRGLAARIPPVELVENRRQREPWEQLALLELRSGDIEQALTAYAEHGRIHTAPDAASAKQRLVDAWLDATRYGEQTIMLAARAVDVDDLNRLARDRLAEHDVVQGPEIKIGDHTFQTGDRVVTLRNNYDLDVRNGTLATVAKVHPRRGDLTIRTDTGDTQRLPAAYLHAGHVDHGYSITIHKAQGLTVDRAFVLGSSDLYRELSYVALSRGRISNEIYLAAPEARVDAHSLEMGNPPTTGELVAAMRISRAEALGIDR
jgi:conjugative relaxase-like TrwC/TraI family protein